MTLREEIIEKLMAKCAQLFGRDPSEMGPQTRFIEDLDAKSVNFVQISSMLEDEYQVEVPYMEFRRKKTFEEAALYIEQLLNM